MFRCAVFCDQLLANQQLCFSKPLSDVFWMFPSWHDHVRVPRLCCTVTDDLCDCTFCSAVKVCVRCVRATYLSIFPYIVISTFFQSVTLYLLSVSYFHPDLFLLRQFYLFIYFVIFLFLFSHIFFLNLVLFYPSSR